MPNSIEILVEKFPGAALSIRKDGPPTYRGEDPYRIIIEGNPNAFRLLGQLLNAMADAVETNTNMKADGWHFIVGTEEIPQLHMDEGHLLSLACEPDFVSPR